MQDLLRVVRELTERGITVEFVKNKMTFKGGAEEPMAKLMLTMLAGFAAFERDLNRERQREGIARAKQRGAYKGRKKALKADDVVQLREMAEAGIPKADLARTYGISRETVYQYLRAN